MANGDVLVDNGIFEYRARPVKLYRQLDMLEESALTKKDGLMTAFILIAPWFGVFGLAVWIAVKKHKQRYSL